MAKLVPQMVVQSWRAGPFSRSTGWSDPLLRFPVERKHSLEWAVLDRLFVFLGSAAGASRCASRQHPLLFVKQPKRVERRSLQTGRAIVAVSSAKWNVAG